MRLAGLATTVGKVTVPEKASDTTLILYFSSVCVRCVVCVAACDAGHWGTDCVETCDCRNGDGSCDPVTGQCNCEAGYTGTQCDQSM